MFISFDNLHELREFLSFIGHSKREPRMVDNWANWTGLSPSTGDAQKTEVKTEPEVKTEVADKPKRTRRTKAELAAPVEQPEQVAEAEPVEQVKEYGEAVTQMAGVIGASLGVDGDGAEVLETPEAEAAPEAESAPAETDAEAFISARADELIASEKVSKPVEHMARCTQFIGAYTRAVYDQSFELAGLPKTIATFKAPQIARHQAALEFLARSN